MNWCFSNQLGFFLKPGCCRKICMPTCHCSVPQAVIAAFNTLAEGSELRLVEQAELLRGLLAQGEQYCHVIYHTLSYDRSLD